MTVYTKADVEKMGFIELKCKTCGALMKIDENDHTARCFYCGNAMVEDKKIVELVGSIGIEGMASMQSLLERSFLFIEDGNFDKASEYLEKVLDIAPKCAKAYWGKLLCTQKTRRDEDLIKLPYTLDGLNDYKKAAAFSQGEEKQRYLAVNEKLRAKVAQNGACIQIQIPGDAQAEQEKQGRCDRELVALRAMAHKETAPYVIMLILMIVVGAFLAFMFIGLIGVIATEGMSLYEIVITLSIISMAGIPFYFIVRRFEKAKYYIALLKAKERTNLR